jgi:nucleoside-diphosphate-sugar epimerase
LLEEGQAVTAFDLSQDDHRLRLVLKAEQRAAVKVVRGDITDPHQVEDALSASGAGRIIHLAALQVPFCKADPPRGAMVNVTGMVNVFEAARKCGVTHLAYASSVGVFGLSEEYPDASQVADDAPLQPRSLYGVFKQANEALARVYWWDHHISSIGLRPNVVYGPGRDQGMTSGTTWAMAAAAAGRAYQIPFGGLTGLNYVEDVALAFISASRANQAGSEVLNMRGNVVDVSEVIRTITEAAPQAVGQITHASTVLPIPAGLDDHRLRALFPEWQETGLREGVQRTIAHFRAAIGDGRMAAECIPA